VKAMRTKRSTGLCSDTERLSNAVAHAGIGAVTGVRTALHSIGARPKVNRANAIRFDRRSFIRLPVFSIRVRFAFGSERLFFPRGEERWSCKRLSMSIAARWAVRLSSIDRCALSCVAVLCVDFCRFPVSAVRRGKLRLNRILLLARRPWPLRVETDSFRFCPRGLAPGRSL